MATASIRVVECPFTDRLSRGVSGGHG